MVNACNHASHRNDWLDFCRALAITLVLLSHGRQFLTPFGDIGRNLKFGGFLGVELFFVLSGFLIGGIIIDRVSNSETPFGWVRVFWIRRWLRTVPNYLLFLAINLALLSLSVRVAEWPDILSYLFFVQNLAWPHPSFYGEAWSLAVEEVFYLSMPILIGMLLLLGVKKDKALIVIAVLVLVLSLGGRSYFVYYGDPVWDEGVRKVVLFRLDALMIGVLLAASRLVESWMQVVRRFALGSVALLVPAIYLAMQPAQWLDQSDFARILLFPLASLGCAGFIVVGINIKLAGIIKNMSGPLAQWSYAAYLVNLPLSATIQYFFPVPPTNMVGAGVRWLIFMLGTMLVSAVVLLWL